MQKLNTLFYLLMPVTESVGLLLITANTQVRSQKKAKKKKKSMLAFFKAAASLKLLTTLSE